MGTILTHKARLEQYKDTLWRTLDNQLYELNNGRLALVPRGLITDNNSNPFGANDLCDVRASHFHDLGCRYRQLIYVNLSVEKLKSARLLRLRKDKKTQEDIWICEDIPTYFLSLEKADFVELNRIFKEILLACNTGRALSNLMGFAVNFNIGWLFGGKSKLDFNKIYKDFI